MLWIVSHIFLLFLFVEFSLPVELLLLRDSYLAYALVFAFNGVFRIIGRLALKPCSLGSDNMLKLSKDELSTIDSF